MTVNSKKIRIFEHKLNMNFYIFGLKTSCFVKKILFYIEKYCHNFLPIFEKFH